MPGSKPFACMFISVVGIQICRQLSGNGTTRWLEDSLSLYASRGKKLNQQQNGERNGQNIYC
jgi:hypothetical protein